MSVKTKTCIVCDRCGAEGPGIVGTGPSSREAKAAAAAQGWVRIHNPDYGKGSRRGMDDLCPECKTKSGAKQ